MKYIKWLCLFLMLAITGVVQAGDIKENDISFAASYTNEGMYQITVPIYDDAGADEGLHTNRRSQVKAIINGQSYVLCEMYSFKGAGEPQNDSDWYWVQIKRRDSSVLAALYAQNTKNGTYDVEIGWNDTRVECLKSGSKTKVELYIYLKPEALEKDAKFNVYLYVDKNSGNDYSVERTSTNIQKMNFPIPSIQGPEIDATNAGFEKVTASISRYNGTPYIKFDNESSYTQTANRTASYEVSTSEKKRTVSVEYKLGKNNNLSIIKSSTFIIDQYQHVVSFSAEDSKNGTTILSWNTPANVDKHAIDVGGFRLQKRIGDNSWATLAELTSDSRSYLDENTITQPEKVSYRIFRTKPWASKEYGAKEATIVKDLKHAQVTEFTSARLLTQRNVELTWKWNYNSNDDKKTVLLDNSKFILIRQISLDGKDFMVDETTELPCKKYINGGQICVDTVTIPQSCVLYRFQIYMKPANTAIYSEGTPIYTSNYYIGNEPVADNAGINDKLVAGLEYFKASHGYYGDRVELDWKLDETQSGSLDVFSVQRREYGVESTVDNPFIQIGTVSTVDGISYYSYTDTKAVPGVTYEYLIEGRKECANEEVRTQNYSYGFCTPTGNIYGRITFDSENGQAVKDAEVRLETSTNIIGRSYRLDNDYYLEVENPKFYTESVSALTLQAFVKFDREDATASILQMGENGDKYKLYTKHGKFYFSVGTDILMGDSTIANLKGTQRFNQLTAVCEQDTLRLYTNGKQIGKQVRTAISTIAGTAESFVMGKGLNGYIDEVRVWSKALSESEVVLTSDRYLAGNEDGLVAYWTFNYATSKEFYDFAHKESKFFMNDGRIKKGNFYMEDAKLSDNAEHNPTLNQLGYKDYTDVDGSYYIAGVPYVGNGTLYTVLPKLGTHEFSPTKKQVTLSAGSVNHSVNFVDKSSFPVSGTVTYKGGTIPVEGVQFYVDGVVCSDSKGNIISSNAQGKFTISVPVGQHQVQAKMSNHTFEFDGKLLDDYGNDINYQDDRYSTVRLTDITTVRYIGRIAGGSVEESYPVGHSLSKNNLADGISLQLTYENAAYKINQATGDSIFTVAHMVPGNWKDQGKTDVNSTKVRIRGNVVTIEPDVKTGEFVVDLPPINYAIKVNVPGEAYNNIPGNNSKLNLSESFVKQFEAREYEDSVLIKNKYITSTYRDTVYYNVKQQFIARVKPVINIEQFENGKTLAYFGDKTAPYLAKDTTKILNLYDEETKQYVLGLPLFTQRNQYTLKASVYEEYPYYDQSGNITEKLADKVPSQNAKISFQTTMRSSNDYEVVEADSVGVAYWTFVAQKVDMTSATANINIKATVGADDGNGVTSIAWTSPFDANNLVLMKGAVSKGNNFITAGPDKVLAVLRDPPGTNSYSYLEKGTTFTESSNYTGGIQQEGSESLNIKVGTELVTFTGVGVGTINSAQQTTGGKVSFEHSEKWTNSHTKTSVTTINTQFATSDDPDYVGAMADVFIGYSTNLSFGAADAITLVEDEYYNENSDNYSNVYDANISSKYILAQTSSLEAGTQFSTMFAYPQVYIKDKLIPTMEEVRNSLLHQSSEMSAARFQAEANSTGKAVYVSVLSPDDENYGKSNIDPVFKNNPKWYKKEGQSIWDGPSYKVYLPTAIKYPTDTIQILNQSIQKWIDRMADNERVKVEAINSGNVLQNFSFQAGANIEYSKGFSNIDNRTNTFNIVVGFGGGTDFDVKILGSGCNFEFEEKIGTTQGGEFTTEQEATTTVGFVLAEDGDDDYLTVDVYQEKGGQNENAGFDDIDSKDLNLSTFIFRTRAGATSCPYEDETVTEYYMPGTVISEKTIQIEVPEIAVENSFIDNVPSGEPAYVKLFLRNNSSANEDSFYDLVLVNESNPMGAGIRMDGSGIGNGRAILVPAGETVTKTLEVTKGSGLNYDDLQLVLISQCQNDPTVNYPVIADTVTFSVHFTPSCSDVKLKTPSNNWTYNTDMPTQKNSAGIDVHYMNVQISDFNVNYDNFHSIRLMYKPSSNSDENWITLMNYYNNEEYYDQAVQNGLNAEMIKSEDKGTISYKWFLDDMPDQTYDLCAATVCIINNEEVLNFSPTYSGVKDMYRPRLFGQPQPANGILTINDEAKITFNEGIAAGYLTENNFSVTGIKNGTQTNHSVAVQMDGNDSICSELKRSFRGKDITFEAWVKLPKDQNATFFRHGTEQESCLSFGITDQRQLTASINGKTYTSEVITTRDYLDNWNHVAMVLEQAEDETATGRLTLYFNFTACLEVTKVPAYTGNATYQLAQYLNAQIHNVRIWTAARTSGQLQAQSNQLLSGNEENLLSYYPMDEARGLVLKDKARGLNLAMSGGDWVLPEGRGTRINGSNSFLKLNSGNSVVIDTDGDYTIELWFKGGSENSNATLLANGRADGTDWGGSENLFRLGFESGLLTYKSNQQSIQAEGNYLDDNWHHVAIAVNRMTNRSQLYVDGALAAYGEATDYGRLASAYIYAGVTPVAINSTTNTYTNYFNGTLDDIRFWGLYKNEASVFAGMSNKLDGTEMGLLSYYPFEVHTVTSQNIPVVRYSLADAKVPAATELPNVGAIAVIGDREFSGITNENRTLVENAFMTSAIAPVKDKGGVTDLLFDFVVNNDALIITLKEDAAKVEKTTVTFTVSDIRDLNGNKIASPITWTAYIDRNQLRWSEDELSLVKQVNEPLKFTAEVVNQGGYTESYTISNQPSWMDVEPASGTLTATKSQKITFTVDESLNIGTYDETLYLTNSEGVNEPLHISLKVNGERPNWSVNPADYQYSMNVYGKLRIDGRFSNDTEDLLAAFYNNVCVGVASNQYVKVNDTYYTLITIYSNEASTDTLDFKIWDASTGTTYVASPEQRITFKANSIIGTPVNPVVFSNLDLKQLDIQLNSGWTWTSFNITNEGMKDIQTTLQYNSWQNGDEIKREDGGMATYGSKTGWVNDGLDAFTPDGMYLIRSSVAQTISLVGTPVDVTQRTLTIRSVNDRNVAVWNYIPYWSQRNLTVTEALSGYDAREGDVIKSQNSFAMYNNRLGWIGSLTYMQPGRGYMLQRTGTSSTTLQYPSEAVSSRRVVTRAAKEPETFDVGQANGNYAHTMSLLATVEGVEATDGDVLRIYADGELIGQSPAICHNENGCPLFFVSIAGDTKRAFDATLEHNGQIVAVAANAGIFESNQVSGTPESPTVIAFVNAEATGIYPSPFTDQLNICRTVNAEDHVNVTISDMNGSIVARFDNCAKQGMVSIHWTGAATLSPGVYLVTIETNGENEVHKVTKIKF